MMTDGMKTAADFLALNPDEFKMFWALIGAEWNDEEAGSDLEAKWFYMGQHMRPLELTVIGAMHSALMAGQKAGRK